MSVKRRERRRSWIKHRTIVRTTNEQQRTLDEIKKMLTHRIFDSYLIFNVASRHRRHRLDFVAVWNRNPRQMLLVRPYWDNKIEIRGYQEKKYTDLALQEVVKNNRFECKLFWGKRLPARDEREGWRDFIELDKKSELALTLFTNRDSS